MNRFLLSLSRRIFGEATSVQRTRPQRSRQLFVECLEERVVPTLIASQVFPLLASGLIGDISTLPAPSTSTVTASPQAITFNAGAAQTITLTDTVGGGGLGTPNGGTVNFTVSSMGIVVGAVNNVPVVNGVAQTNFTILASTPPGTYTVSAVYSGNVAFARSSGTSTFTINPPIMSANCDNPAADALLGTAQSFAVLGASTVTNTGTSSITGDVGVSPGTAIIGFPPGIVAPGKPGSGGTLDSNDALAIGAHNATITAFNNLAGLPSTANLSGQDLGGLTLVPGVYTFSAAAQLTGTLTLDGGGDPNARFVFQIGSTLTTASSSIVNVINGGSPDNVFWQVGSSATIGTTTQFEGNILALTSITLNTRASIACGRALAINGAVTLDTNFIDPVVLSTPPTATTASPTVLQNAIAASLVVPHNAAPVSPTVPQNAIAASPSDPHNAAPASQDVLFIQALYQEMLGRKASDQEVAGWDKILNGSARRIGVVQGIEQSPEARDYLVKSWYKQFLGRQAKGGEEMGLVNLLLKGKSESDVLSRLLASNAFAQRTGISDQQFVKALYIDLLNRTASAVEVHGWVNVISTVGRQTMAKDLLNSQAYRTAAVTGFYHELLGRQPDSELESWVPSRLDLAQIRMHFLESNRYWKKVTK